MYLIDREGGAAGMARRSDPAAQSNMSTSVTPTKTGIPNKQSITPSALAPWIWHRATVWLYLLASARPNRKEANIIGTWDVGSRG